MAYTAMVKSLFYQRRMAKMKKIISLVLITVMAVSMLALVSCGGEKEDLSDSKYVGTWKAVNMSLEDESEDFGEGQWTITLNDDGTGTCVAVDEEGVEETTEFTWEPTDEGFKTKGDMKLKFTDDGEQIHAKMFGVSLNFEKQ